MTKEGIKIEKENGKKLAKGPNEINKKIDDLIILCKECGMDLIADLKKKTGFSEEEIRSNLRIMFDEALFKRVMGVTKEEYWLMKEGLSLKEARYVINNRCLVGPTSECDYHQKHGQCGLCCTNFNGWLSYKTSPDGKLKPNFRALAELPKDTLFIHKPIDEQKLKSNVKEFLDEAENQE